MNCRKSIDGNFKAAKVVSAIIRSKRKNPPRYVRGRSEKEIKRLVSLAFLRWRMKEESGEVRWIDSYRLRVRV